MSRKKIACIIAATVISMNLFTGSISVSADTKIVGGCSATYTDDADFDQGVMNNVSYDNASGELQISKKQNNQNVSLVYSLKDIVLFGYEDDTNVTIVGQSGEDVWSGTINRGENIIVNIKYYGVYKVVTDKKVSILTGDPITSGVSGYYAMDQEGYGASNEFYVQVPKKYDKCQFIVTSMEDNNYVVIENLSEGTIAFEGVLNEGEHYSIEPTKDNIKYKYHVKSTKKSSALVDYDQSYYAPDVNGKWSGTKLYTHIGNTGDWTHELTVYSFADNNNVTITDTETNEVLWSGVLNYGENNVISYEKGTDTYVKIESSDTVTAAVQPWKMSNEKYAQGTYIPDKDGSGIGTDFLGSCIKNGRIVVMAYNDNTTVELYDSLDNNKLLKTVSLEAGKFYRFEPNDGAFHIKSNKAISCYSGYSSANAGFAPIQYGDNVTIKDGSWNVVKDSEIEDNNWNKISWTAETPEGTSIKVSARTANTEEELQNAEYVYVDNGVNSDKLNGRYIQVRVEFNTDSEVSPILKNITVGENLYTDFSGELSANKSSIYNNESLDVDFSIKNDGNASIGEKSYIMKVLNADGNVVKETEPEQISLQAHSKFTGSMKLLGRELGIGEYTVELIDVTDSEPVVLDSCNFKVIKKPEVVRVERVSGSIEIDNKTINNNENATISYSLKNQGNVKLASKEYKIRLLDENNNVVKDIEKSGYSLEVGGQFSDTLTLSGEGLAAGQYTIQLVNVSGNNEDILDSCIFNVSEPLVENLTGTIAGDKEVISNKDTLAIDYSINNEGNIDVDKRDYKVKLLDENNNIVKELVQGYVSLQAGSSYSSLYELSSDELKNGNYTVQLTTVKDGEEAVIASYSFKAVIIEEDEPVIDVKPSDVNKPKEDEISGEIVGVEAKNDNKAKVTLPNTLIKPDAAVADVKANAKTGDNNNVLGYLAAAIASLGAIVLAIRSKFKVKSDK